VPQTLRQNIAARAKILNEAARRGKLDIVEALLSLGTAVDSDSVILQVAVHPMDA
jgi:hypothetical protein